MIYNRSNLIEQFRGLIGFKPSYDSSNTAAKVDAYFAESLSGEYINELHSLFTAENFANCEQQFPLFSVEVWGAGTAYKKGSVVKKANIIYQAEKDSAEGIDPAVTPDTWRATTLLTVWLQAKYDAAVLAVMALLEERKKLEGHGQQLRGNTQLYNSEGLRSNLITKSGRFVGFEIVLKKENISAVLQRVGMQLTLPTGTPSVVVPLHVIYNGVDTVINVTFTGNSKFNYANIDQQAFLADTGSVIIGYYEDDLATAQAIQLYTDVFSATNCSSCSSPDSGLRNAWSKWIDVTAISILNDEVTTYADTNWGLNLVFSFRCDLSDIIIREKESVTEALKGQLRVTLLGALGDTVRNNQQADQVSILAYNQLRDWEDPDNPKVVRDRAIKALDFNFSGISSECMPCNAGVRIKNKNIG